MKKAFLITLISSMAIGVSAQNKSLDSSMAAGKKLYEMYCMTCHQVDGAGAQNMIPPLIKTSYVLGDKATIIKIVLNGMSGEIEVNGDKYSNEMPPQNFLKDEEIAAILTYVRNSFGNKASAVAISEVKKVRSANK